MLRKTSFENKFTIIKSVICIILLIITFYGSYRANAIKEDNIINFSDINLEAVIRKEINRPYQTIKAEDVIEIKELDLSGKEIRDISSLKYFVNLEELNFKNNYVEDIDVLSNLKRLRILNLSNNRVKDCRPLMYLTYLEELDLSYNFSIEDKTFLSELLSLKKLNMRMVNIKDISMLATLVNLTELDLSHNDIEDIRPLANLIKLERLNLGYNKIEDISAISGLTGLTYLNLKYNTYYIRTDEGYDFFGLTDLSPVSNLINLKELNLQHLWFSDLGFLTGLNNIIDLNLGNNDIEDLSPLSHLRKLEKLNLMLNEISDISPLSKLTNLKILDIKANNIKDVSPISGLSNLQYLDLRYNYYAIRHNGDFRGEFKGLSDVAPLLDLPDLQELNLYDSLVQKVKVSDDLQGLWEKLDPVQGYIEIMDYKVKDILIENIKERNYYTISWNPDSSMIAFIDEIDDLLFVVDLNGEIVYKTKLENNKLITLMVKWVDSETIIFTQLDGLKKYHIRTKESIFIDLSPYYLFDFDYDKNNQELAFIDEKNYELMKINLKDNKKIMLIEEPYEDILSVICNRDGSKIFYRTESRGLSNWYIYDVYSGISRSISYHYIYIYNIDKKNNIAYAGEIIALWYGYEINRDITIDLETGEISDYNTKANIIKIDSDIYLRGSKVISPDKRKAFLITENKIQILFFDY